MKECREKERLKTLEVEEIEECILPVSFSSQMGEFWLKKLNELC